jgi:hypothetical protein
LDRNELNDLNGLNDPNDPSAEGLSESEVRSVVEATGRERSLCVQALRAYGSVVDAIMALTME